MSGDGGASGDAEPTPEQRRAAFRVVRGTPTDEELAALAVVLAVAARSISSGTRPDARPPVRSAWADPAAGLRRPLTAGPDAWRATVRPR